MTKLIKLLTFLSIVGLLYSCTAEEVVSPVQTASGETAPWLRTETEITEIALNGARQLGSSIENGSSRSVNQNEHKVLNIVPMYDRFKSRAEQATPLMYAVNFADNQGYAIVSSYKSMPPLIAVVEEGSYDATTQASNPAFDYYMTQLQNSDFWQLDTNAFNFQPAILERTLRDTVGIAFVEPRALVRWGQTNNIEGKYCPNGTSGCSNTALAMAMSYFEWPKAINITFADSVKGNLTLDWTKLKRHKDILPDGKISIEDCYMYDYPIHDNLGKLMRELGYRANTRYKSDGNSPTPIDGTISAAQSLGYNTFRKQFEPESALNFMGDDILIIYGSDSVQRIAHMWVCDGYKKYSVVEKYQRYQGTPQKWVTIGTDSKNYLYNHFNWGWNGKENGYFIDMDFRNFDTRIYFILLIR